MWVFRHGRTRGAPGLADSGTAVVCYGAKTTMPEDKSTLAVSSEQTMRVLRNIIESDFRPVANVRDPMPYPRTSRLTSDCQNTASLVTRGKSADESLFEALQMDY